MKSYLCYPLLGCLHHKSLVCQLCLFSGTLYAFHIIFQLSKVHRYVSVEIQTSTVAFHDDDDDDDDDDVDVDSIKPSLNIILS